MMRDEIIARLQSLITQGCIAVKLSTEDAGNSFPQIMYWTEEIGDRIPIVVKIGGPEARNDIRELGQMDIRGLIAPMIESDYGLKAYINALRDILPEERYRSLSKRVNIETYTAYKNIDSILSIEEARDLQVLTIGRTDLSKSMGLHVDDSVVTSIARKITQKARGKGIKVSVGGNITNLNAERIKREIGPDFVNTRSVGFDFAKCGNIGKAVLDALEFEEIMMQIDLEKGFVSREEAERRIHQLRERRLTRVA
jgi:hypothetical protein